MNVGHMCQRNVVTVQARDEIALAARLMREKHVGFLVVVEPAAQEGALLPVGVITDRDIVVSTIGAGVDPRTLCVGDVMTCKPTVALAQDSIADAICQMRHTRVRRLPVVGDYGHLPGVLSLDDVLTSHADELGAATAVITKAREAQPRQRAPRGCRRAAPEGENTCPHLDRVGLPAARSDSPAGRARQGRSDRRGVPRGPPYRAAAPAPNGLGAAEAQPSARVAGQEPASLHAPGGAGSDRPDTRQCEADSPRR